VAAKKYLDETGLEHFWDKTAYKYGIERIEGTQSASTNAWTGTSLDKNCASSTIPTGKVIVYKLPYAGTSSAATLNLTLPDGTTSGAKNVKYNTGSNVTTTYGANCEIFMVYDGTNWKCAPWYDSNNYDRVRHNCAVKAAAAITNGTICVGTSAGYKMAASGTTFDIGYPILRAGEAVSSGSTSSAFYDVLTANLQTTKSGWTGTAYTQTWLVGTLSGTTFTIDSAVFTQTIPSTADGKVYTPIGITYDTKQIYLHPTNEYWEYRNGAFSPISTCPTLATVATSGSYNDLSNKPTIPAAQVNSDWNSSSGVSQILNKPTLATVATSGSYNDLSNKPTIPTVNNATLTIQKNGTTVKTFTANASSNVTANITVPTNNNELTNGAGYITSSGSITGNAATATKATQDSDGNAINTTYLKKSGGTMTGAITRALASSGTIADTNLFTVTGSTDGFGVNYSSTTADVGITTLYTTDDANAKLSLGNKISSTYKEAISIVNGSATVTGSVSGNAGTATKLETARTIGIGTGATGTATSFNGTANITIPITDVKESYVSWGGKQLTNNMISPDDMGCIDEFGHNKLAFLPASCIDVAYTTDGGTTWVDYGLTDAQKVKMVTTSGVSMYVGGSSDNATADNIANLKLRVRIAAGPTSGGKVYTAAKKLLINFSSQGAGGNKVQIRHRTIANYIAGTDTWINVGTYDIAGGSGWNSYPYVSTFGGSFSTQTGQIGQLEFIFYCTTLGTWGLKKPCAIDFRMIGATNWTMPSEMARAGHIYTFDENQVTTFPADVIVTGRVYPSADNSKDCGAGTKRWKDIYLSGALKNNTYTWSLPSKTGTVALTSDLPTVNNATLTIQKNGTNVQTFTANASSNVTANITVPTKTSDLTNNGADNTSTYIETDDAQIMAAGQGNVIPCFDGMTPIKTFTWTVADTTYRPIYQFDNTGWTRDNLNKTLAYRITVTGTNIKQVVDVNEQWFDPLSWPVTSVICRTLSADAATTGIRYLRAVYPISAGLNNNTYKFGSEIGNYNATSRTIQVDVFKTADGITWNETKPSGTIYTSSSYQTNNSIQPYATRGWMFRAPASFNATTAARADCIQSYEGSTTGSSVIQSGEAVTNGHLAYLADDGKVYDISNTTKNMVADESGIVGMITNTYAANKAMDYRYFRRLYNMSSTQVGYISHDTLALGSRVYLRCTMDSSGNIHSGNYLATSMAAGYTWLPFGVATATNTIYMDVRRPTFYTLDSSGKISHINGKAVAGTTYTAGAHINITGSTIKAVDYVHSESGVSASTVTQTVTNSMIADGTIKFAKVDSTEFVKLTMSTTDISAGSALAKNTLYGVYS